MIILPDTGRDQRFLVHMVSQVSAALDLLPEPERLVVWFRVSMGLDDIGTAEAVSVPAGNVARLVDQGMRRIMSSLFRKGICTDERSVAAVLSALARRSAPAVLRNRIAVLTQAGYIQTQRPRLKFDMEI
ncbi:MAG: hypothetical protein C0404_11655 [Verrucomicrobia bacterium]|nr:hypothetical protein [Verrucomicrobiota bacterium]